MGYLLEKNNLAKGTEKEAAGQPIPGLLPNLYT